MPGQSTPTTWRQHFTTYDDFLEAVTDGDLNAKSSWEMSFMCDMKAKVEQWGDRTYLSEEQAKVLKRIAGV